MRVAVYKTADNEVHVVDYLEPRYIYFSKTRGEPVIHCEATEEARADLEAHINGCMSGLECKLTSLYGASVISRSLFKEGEERRK